jgi:phage host-nuclease inhibitor protein Gam
MTAILPDTDLPALPESQDEASLVAFADRLLREIGDIQRELAANQAACKAEVARVTGGWDDVNLAIMRREARLYSYLETVAAQIPMRGKKSRTLGGGVIGWRQSNARLEVVDEAKVRAWVIVNCTQAERLAILEPITTEKLRKTALNELALTTGEIPDGAELKPAADVFYVKATEPHE